MSYSAKHYLNQLKAQLPRGMLWDSLREEGNDFSELLAVSAAELARIEARAEDLLDEADPRTTYELLPEHEKEAGLPDTCTTQADTLQERRDALVAKLTSVGGQSRQYFIDIAAALGYTITIAEAKASQFGKSYGDLYNGVGWRFVWYVDAPTETVRPRRFGQSGYGEPYRDWGNEQLECLINRLKPAHTKVYFRYGV
ncbi:YmfQ family protein [Sulfuriflexus mobilis]|uniref:YmfQ family protein n=1 Tax=Sulfuriflexus mobilis TaxID=1811807 RepID=UPI000F843864|nr:putative phage tail protein [Sulfuriflexus mobilis]